MKIIFKNNKGKECFIDNVKQVKFPALKKIEVVLMDGHIMALTDVVMKDIIDNCPTIDDFKNRVVQHADRYIEILGEYKNADNVDLSVISSLKISVLEEFKDSVNKFVK